MRKTKTGAAGSKASAGAKAATDVARLAKGKTSARKVASPQAAAKQPAKGKTVETEIAGDRVPLKKLAASLGIEPKKARRHLRKAIRAGDFAGHEIGAERWSFTGKQAARAKELLRAYV